MSIDYQISGNSTGRTVLVLHSAAMSGPARSFASRLPLTASAQQRLVVVPGAGPAGDIFADIAEVRRLRYVTLTVPSRPLEAIAGMLNFAKDVLMFLQLYSRERTETVISATTYTPAAYLASKLGRRRTIIYCGELISQPGDRRLRKKLAAKLLIRLIAWAADEIICCSSLVRLQFSVDAPATAVYPSIPVAELRKLRQARPAASSSKTVAAIGGITHRRGQDILIRAMPAIRAACGDVRLLVAGSPVRSGVDDAFLAELRGLVADYELGNVVEFLGHVSNIGELLRTVEVVVNPARFDEPFGRVAYEALAAGCSVVVSDTGANTELLVDQQTALVVEPGDVPATARAVIRLLSNPEEQSRMIHAAEPVLDAIRREITDQAYVDALFPAH